VKLKSARKRSTQQVIDDVRNRIDMALPRIEWEFPGILSDLIGDLIWTDEPIEIKIFSTDTDLLKKQAKQVAQDIADLPGIVDLNNGLIYTGSTISLRVLLPQAQHFGLTTNDIGSAVNTAMLGQIASTVLEADRVLNISREGRSICNPPSGKSAPASAEDPHRPKSFDSIRSSMSLKFPVSWNWTAKTSDRMLLSPRICRAAISAAP